MMLLFNMNTYTSRFMFLDSEGSLKIQFGKEFIEYDVLLGLHLQDY